MDPIESHTGTWRRGLELTVERWHSALKADSQAHITHLQSVYLSLLWPQKTPFSFSGIFIFIRPNTSTVHRFGKKINTVHPSVI